MRIELERKLLLQPAPAKAMGASTLRSCWEHLGLILMYLASHHMLHSVIGPWRRANWEWAAQAADQEGEGECVRPLSDDATRSWTR